MAIGWKLATALSRLLTPDERHAVLGDLMESGATGARAVHDVLGLIVRREAALWKDWRPWLALFAFLVLIVVTLPRVLTALGSSLPQYVRTYQAYGVRY